jgi:hypothetical protein
MRCSSDLITLTDQRKRAGLERLSAEVVCDGRQARTLANSFRFCMDIISRLIGV